MRFRKERVFDYPCEKVVNFIMEGESTVYDMSSLENVTGWKVIKEEDLGDKRVGTKEWCAHAQIPKVLQHIVSPKMLTWLEHSVWNRKTNVYMFEIEPFYFRKKVKCKGTTTYAPKGKDKTLRSFELDLKVDIPIAGPIFEALVMDHLKKNEQQDFEMCSKTLREKLK